MESRNFVPSKEPVELSPQELLKNDLNYGEPTFSNVLTSPELQDNILDGKGDVEVKVGKSPRRILNFSDGTLEEYSSDEEEEGEEVDSSRTVSKVDPKTLSWKSWIWYQTVVVGSTSLRVCDYLGESLASFFGITSAKYQYEIDEYNRIVEEEEAEKKKQDLEMRGWAEANKPDTVHTTETTGQRF